ncbi:MAG TPA: c-type cytochrome [Kofleriaceae bacterium]|nr:c-type cytochrome [Kofleriaceae bacterium]
MKFLRAVIVLAACNQGAAKPPPAAKHEQPAAPVATRGDAGVPLYQKLCAQCHGADGKGYKSDHAPSLVNPTFLASATDDFLKRSIALGRPGTAMAGYGKEVGGPLDADQVAAIVAFLRTQGKATPDRTPALQAGSPERGKPLYAANCQKCHGDQTTRGEAPMLANANFLQAASDEFMAYAIVHGRPGTPMEAWGMKLSDQSLSDVIAYVRNFATPQQVGELPPPTGKEPLFINPQGKPPTDFKLTADPGQKPRYVSADQVKKAFDEKRKMIIIDARPPSDWMKVHITGAVSIPYHEMSRLDEIPKDAWVIAYCACPHHLSGIVADELQKRGYPHALVLDEGILEWHRRGYPVVAAPGVLPPPADPTANVHAAPAAIAPPAPRTPPPTAPSPKLPPPPK